jgi:hypothetical protein
VPVQLWEPAPGPVSVPPGGLPELDQASVLPGVLPGLDQVSVLPGGLLEQDLASVPQEELHEQDLVSVPQEELRERVQVSVPPVELLELDPASVPQAEVHERVLASVPRAELHEQDPVSVLEAGSLEPGLVPVAVRLERLEQWGDHGILSATLQPAHVGVVHKISGHSGDLAGVRDNRDTLAENSPSNADFVYTTHSTSEHTTD